MTGLPLRIWLLSSLRWLCSRRLDSRVAKLALIGVLQLLSPLWPARAEERVREFPGLDKPRILPVGVGQGKGHGYWWSLAFAEDGQSLVGVVVRRPASNLQFFLQPAVRVSEVHAVDLTSLDAPSQIVIASERTQYQILKSPHETFSQPLRLAAYDESKQSVGVLTLASLSPGSKETRIGQFAVPRPERMNYHVNRSVSAVLAPSPELILVYTGCADWDAKRRPICWGDVKAWDLQSGKVRFADAWDGNQVVDIACSADGKLIAAAGGRSSSTYFGGDRYTGRVVCWDENFNKRFDLEIPAEMVHCLGFSPDGATLVAGGLYGRVHWIDVAKETVIQSVKVASRSGKTLGKVEALAYSPNAKLLAAGVGCWNRGGKWGETFLIDVSTKEVYAVPSSPEDHVITCVAFSPDGKYLAAGGMRGILKLWRLDSNRSARGESRSVESRGGGAESFE